MWGGGGGVWDQNQLLSPEQTQYVNEGKYWLGTQRFIIILPSCLIQDRDDPCGGAGTLDGSRVTDLESECVMCV